LARTAQFVARLAMTENATATLSEADLARLDALLAEEPLRERALPLDALQGMFCALAIGPDADTPLDLWLPAALGDDPDRDAPEHPIELVELLTRFHDDTERAARDGTLSLLLYEMRRGRQDYATWCRGFVEGVELSEAGWYESADPDEIEELLFPILVAGDQLSEDERRAYKPAEWRRLLLESEQRIPETVARLRDYWAIVRSPPQTVRRDGAKVGRNDPCPCGSGRKFKHCHGT
jgi:uncharacterized protein